MRDTVKDMTQLLTSPFVSPCSAWGWFIQSFSQAQSSFVLKQTICFPAPCPYVLQKKQILVTQSNRRVCKKAQTMGYSSTQYTQRLNPCKHNCLFNCFVFWGSQNTIKANKFGEFCSNQARIFCWMKRLRIAQIQVRLTETKDHCSLKAAGLSMQQSFKQMYVLSIMLLYIGKTWLSLAITAMRLRIKWLMGSELHSCPCNHHLGSRPVAE